ncbi:MAG: C40 family peptidase [Ignavibacteriales bacterium]|nr:C40 family peptidase [Ignavibacteriales bacterium]
MTDTLKIEATEDPQVDEEDEEIPDTEIIEPTDEIESRILISEDNPSVDRHKLLSEIMPLMRTPYRKKGIGNKGFDCSGFTKKVYQDGLGYELPRSSKAQFSLGQRVDRDSLKFGDLVFFKTRRTIPSHVGIYVGDGLFAHASLKIGVTISLLDSKYYKKRYVGARRIIE